MALSPIEKLTAPVMVFLVGLLILAFGGRDAVSYLVGGVFTALGALGSYLQLKIVIQQSRIKQVVKDSQVSDSAIVGQARDVHIYHSPPPSEQHERSQSPQEDDESEEKEENGDEVEEDEADEEAESEPLWNEDDSIVLAYDEFQEYPLDLDKGDLLTGEVEADGPVSVLLLGPSSLKSFRAGQEVKAFWRKDDIKRTTLRLFFEEAKQLTLVVSNENEDNEDEEKITVSVKYRVESSELEF